MVFDSAAPRSSASTSSEFTSQLPIQVSFSAEDDTSGVFNVQLWVKRNDGEFVSAGLVSEGASGIFEYSPAPPSDGSYSFATRGMDRAGNLEAATQIADSSIILDRTAPESSCSSDSNLVNSFPLSIDYVSSDAGSGIQNIKLFFRLDGGQWIEATTASEASGTMLFNPPDALDGAYEFYTIAHDVAGNVEDSNGADASVLVDSAPPSSSASSPKTVAAVPFNVSFTANDDGSGPATTALWASFNGADWGPTGLSESGTAGEFVFEAPNGEGQYRFYTICEDTAGNVEAPPADADATTVYHVPEPSIQSDRGHVDFGEVFVGNQKSATVIISNAGDADLDIQEISVSPAVFSAHAAAGQLLPFALSPSDSFEIEVVFSPDNAGEFSGELTVHSNDPDSARLDITLNGSGTVTREFRMAVSTNSDLYEFGDTLQIDVDVLNASDTVTADVYLVLTFDLGGPDEASFSATLGGDWVDGILPFAAGLGVPSGFQFAGTWWSHSLPCYLPALSRSGLYTLRMAAIDTYTFDFASNLAVSEFTLEGEPFVGIFTDKDVYSPSDTKAQISLDVSLPDYEITADFYISLIGPDGQLWFPNGFGEDVVWSPDVASLVPNVTLPSGFSFSTVIFESRLHTKTPFDSAGEYVLLVALVEPNSLVPLSDIGQTLFGLQKW